MQPEPTNQQPPESGWQFTPQGSPQTPAEPQYQEPIPSPVASEGREVSWTASEFIAHQKNASWYGLLALAGVTAAAVTYLLTRDIISTIMVLIVLIFLGVYAAHKPRTLDYKVDDDGVHIGNKSYFYKDVKSFSVIDEGALSAINLVSMKRLMPPITMYYDPKDEKHIVDVLSTYLPFEEAKDDAVDRMMKRIRF